MTMDLHAAQIQGFFDIPVDNLLGNPIFVDYYGELFGAQAEEMVVVSPDVGSVSRARAFAQKLGMSLAIVDKRRPKANSCEVMNIIGDVKGRDCILFDDMVDTAGSICNACLLYTSSVLSFRPKPSIIIRVVGVFISIRISREQRLPTIALFLICGVDDGDELIGRCV